MIEKLRTLDVLLWFESTLGLEQCHNPVGILESPGCFVSPLMPRTLPRSINSDSGGESLATLFLKFCR